MSKGYDAETKMGVLLDDPAAKAVLASHLPEVNSAGPMLSMARGLTLRAISGFPQAKLSPEKLSALVADLAKL